jgi:hypothetical protein
MNRSVKTFVIILASVAIGACAERARVIVVPSLPVDVVDASATVSASPEPMTLPVASRTFTELLDVSCDVPSIIAKTTTDPELLSAPLTVGDREIRYVEVRSNVLKQKKDYVKDIALRVLDTRTCTTRIVIVTKAYGQGVIDGRMQTIPVLKTPPGWHIEVVRRANDIAWNNWGTQFHITAPSGQVVVGLRYPLVAASPRKGSPRVTYVTYVPYSESLAIPSLIHDGVTYLEYQERRVKDELRQRGVRSHAFPDLLIADAMERYPRAYPLKYLLPIEHMDESEFFLDPQWTTNRVHVVIGTNQERFATHTCSPVGACGPQQFMPDSYRMVRDRFPSAALVRDIDQGRQDAFNSMKAAALLFDLQLEQLKNMLGDAIAEDPYLDEIQIAGYNTGPSRSGRVYGIALIKHLAEWTDARGNKCTKATRYAECLITETKGYIAKYRYLRDSWLPRHLTAHP